jgi:hypothetical protein
MQSTKIEGVNMNVIIDRFEEKYAICQREDYSMVNIDRKTIPSDAKEGDVLNIKGDCISIDIEETKKKKNEIKKLIKDLWE